MAYEDDNDEDNHPALRRFSRFAAMAKHVAVKALKWAAIGAVVGAAVFAFFPGVAALLGSAVSAVVGYLPFVGEKAASGLLAGGSNLIVNAATQGLKFGALMAIPGAIIGLTSASDAADEEAERRRDSYESREDRLANKQMLELNMAQTRMAMNQQAAQMGLNPNVGLPSMGQDSRYR